MRCGRRRRGTTIRTRRRAATVSIWRTLTAARRLAAVAEDQQDPEADLQDLRAEVAALRAELADAQIESLRAEVTLLRAELAKARLNDEASSGKIAALRVMLKEARASTRRPSGLDGRRLIYPAGNP